MFSCYVSIVDFKCGVKMKSVSSFRHFITIFTWKHVFQEILEEIEEEREKRHLSMVEPVIEGEEDDNGIVLVACKDEFSCMQLEDCIIKGPHKVFQQIIFPLANDFHLFSCLVLLLRQAAGKPHNSFFQELCDYSLVQL